MREIWKDVVGLESYQISNFGNLRTLGRMVPSSVGANGFRRTIAKNLKLNNNGRGYLLFGFQIGRKKKNYYIHRLVAEAFIPNSNSYKEVNHKDCNKANNHVSNLEWCTILGNRRHAVKNNLVAFGERCRSSKLTEAKVRQIRERFSNGELARDIASYYKINSDYIYSIINRQTWSRVK